jgi:precorrin-6B C5,15-methyltransferase / cobalt-precorrin-6B C5,C15-methyltransferase
VGLTPAPGAFPPVTSPELKNSPAPVLVVGLPLAGPLPEADVYVGALRHLEIVPPGKAVLALGSTGASLAAALDRTAEVVASGRRVCVLTQGDPGFFGVGRAFADRFGPGSLEIRPAPSPISLAFARLGLPWDDAIVVSAQGRNPVDALVIAHRASSGGHKVAVLSGTDAPPERIGQAILEATALDATAGPGKGAVGQLRPPHQPALSDRDRLTVAVCSRLGTPQERVTLTDLEGLARGAWDPPSVVLLLPAEALEAHRPPAMVWSGATRSWLGGAGFGRDPGAFLHRDAMANRPEVRAVVLSKLDLPLAGVLWCIGAGAGSLAIEAVLLAPGLEVHAVEEDPRAATQARANAGRHSAAVKVHNLHAPVGLAGLSKPDRVFIQAGGSDVLEACLGYLAAGGRVVSASASLEGALTAGERLGALVQVTIAGSERVAGGGWRLAGDDPIFIAWGPQERRTA